MTESACQWYIKKLTQMKTPLFQTQEQSLESYEAENNGLCLTTDHGSTFTVTQRAVLALKRASLVLQQTLSLPQHSCSHDPSSASSYSAMRAVHSPLRWAKPAQERGMSWPLTHEMRCPDTYAGHLESLSAICPSSSWQICQVCPYRHVDKTMCAQVWVQVKLCARAS